MSDTLRTDAYAKSKLIPERWEWIEMCEQLERELNAANERIKRLEEVLDEVYHAGRVGASLRAEKAWRKAKEAKP